MEREFKFEVGQYVVVKEEHTVLNALLPKYPCKVKSRRFDGNDNYYNLDTWDGSEVVVLETSLVAGGVEMIEYLLRVVLDLHYSLQRAENRIENLSNKVSSMYNLSNIRI